MGEELREAPSLAAAAAAAVVVVAWTRLGEAGHSSLDTELVGERSCSFLARVGDV